MCMLQLLNLKCELLEIGTVIIDGIQHFDSETWSDTEVKVKKLL